MVTQPTGGSLWESPYFMTFKKLLTSFLNRSQWNQFFTASQQFCGKVMISVASVHQSVIFVNGEGVR